MYEDVAMIDKKGVFKNKKKSLPIMYKKKHKKKLFYRESKKNV